MVISVSGGPVPNGHYSQAIIHNDVVYVSGQLGRGPQMADGEAGGIEQQVRRSLTNIGVILRAAGSDMSLLLKVNIYMPNIELWPAVDAVYREMLGNHRPARAVIPTGTLHFGALIEIDAIAALSQSRR